MRGQLSLFNSSHDTISEASASWTIYVDGASRGNPGPSGAGMYITRNEAVFLKQGFFLGRYTNNQAEYFALLLALCQIKTEIQKGDRVLIISDSQLLVRQVLGEYSVKNMLLRTLHQRVLYYLQGVQYRITHVLRSENTVADLLANEGIDALRAVPEELREHCLLKLDV